MLERGRSASHQNTQAVIVPKAANIATKGAHSAKKTLSALTPIKSAMSAPLTAPSTAPAAVDGHMVSNLALDIMKYPGTPKSNAKGYANIEYSNVATGKATMFPLVMTRTAAAIKHGTNGASKNARIRRMFICLSALTTFRPPKCRVATGHLGWNKTWCEQKQVFSIFYHGSLPAFLLPPSHKYYCTATPDTITSLRAKLPI